MDKVSSNTPSAVFLLLLYKFLTVASVPAYVAARDVILADVDPAIADLLLALAFPKN
jgi:hypothetical protein